MLVVLASAGDRPARDLVARWQHRRAALLTPADLSVAGWSHLCDRPAAGTAIVSGRRVAVAEIAGVLVRLPAVGEAELLQIVARDRAYVAAEMTAFLAGWLQQLPCPVLNRPHPVCLCGSNWHALQWAQAAAREGCAIHPNAAILDTAAATAPPPNTVAATVVGSRVVGTVAPERQAIARHLARAAGVELLGVHFARDTSEFVGVSLFPDVTSPEVTAALEIYFDTDPLPGEPS